MTQRKLKDGEVFKFDNEEFQTSIQGDDIRCATVWLDKNKRQAWQNGFKIHFNGVLIHTCKGFQSLEHRLNRLIEKWNLKTVTEVEQLK